MNCPVCKKTAMEPCTLEPALDAQRCPGCRGVWIRGQVYWSYVLVGGTEAPSPSDAATQIMPPRLSGSGKFCPECRRFMRRFHVAADVPFAIDRCAACHGIWLDDLEWEALRAHRIHRKLHLIATPEWQAAVIRARQQFAADETLRKKLGESDFAELMRLGDWLVDHPLRIELMAYLRERFVAAEEDRQPPRAPKPVRRRLRERPRG